MSFVRARLVFIGVLTWSVAAATSAQTVSGRETTAASVERYALTDQMPVDPEVLVGALPNGLRFYVRPNGKPARRAELRLVVKAGSALEDDDQRGLAHFVEHMLFEGTEHFPGQGVVDFLSSLGLSIGADANAQTSYDDTQYTLRVPTDVPGVLDRALLVLEDWAHAATFDQAGIDRQRGIVTSEWRMHLGANERTEDKIRQVQLEGSRYPDRTPIGVPEIIQRATREQLTRYYRDWYRPDLMAVIVVGDVNREQVAAMIRSHFASLVAPSPERPRPTLDIPDRPGTRFAIVTDKETPRTAVQISDLRPARNQGSVGGYRDIMKDQLFGEMLGARLDELSQSANPPFLRAAAERSLFPAPRTRDEAIIQALVANDGVTRGLDALLTEIQRVDAFGFTDTELARAKQSNMAGSERVVAESPDRESESRADEYTRNFLEDEALPTIWQELAFHRRFLPQITLGEMNALSRDWFPDINRVVVVTAPEAAGVKLPTEAELSAVVRAVASKKLESYVDAGAGLTLMDKPPARGSIVNTTTRAEGITEWTLSNGATVVLKPTTLRAGQILFRAFAPGGESLASDADLIPARAADTVIPAGGAARFSDVLLDKIVAGKAVAVRPFIDEIDQGIAGGSTPEDLETMFQLMYLRFTEPRADQTAYAALLQQARALLANQSASPDVVFNQAIRSALSQNSPRRALETPQTVASWNLDKSMAFYKARFADASNFTFVFVGSFTPDMIRPFVETYVASLPATHSHEKWRDVGIRPPAGVVNRTIQQGIAPKSQVAIVFSGAFQYDDPHKVALRAVTLVLQSRLFDALRQELGGTYSVTVNPSMQALPNPEYTVRIEFTCDPARTDMMVDRVFREVNELRFQLFSAGQLGVIRNALQTDYDKNVLENGYLLSQIARRYEDGEAANVGAVFKLPEQIAALNGEQIHNAAQAYLNPANYVKVILMPEGK